MNTSMLKRIALSAMLLSAISCIAQQTIYGTLLHGGLQRTYILYIPASYSATHPAPLVLNFHGYTSNAAQQIVYGEFRPIADTAGFILVCPQGTNDQNGQPYWNANWGGAVDDIGFTAALIDSLSAHYAINQQRIYSTGMSNGGFMSYSLACGLSNRIAAIASVTGSFNTYLINNCTPQHPIPVMEIHGTNDPTVPYNGNASSFFQSIPATLAYWASTNLCDPTPISTAVPNTNVLDGCTAEHYLYKNGVNGTTVEHFKIIGGAHTWPGAPVTIGVTNRDINASKEIWRFFSQYDIHGKIGYVGLNELSSQQAVVLPNPVTTSLSIDLPNNQSVLAVELLNAEGKILRTYAQFEGKMDVSTLKRGVYLLHIKGEETASIVRFVKE